MKIHNLLVIFLFVISSALYAQSTNKKGFIVLNEGDTLHGYIKYKAWEQNPSRIKFYKEEKAKNPRIYTVNEVRFFEVTGFDVYQRGTIYRKNEMDVLVPQSVWLRELVKGEVVSLYQWNRVKDHFFMKENEEMYTELKYPDRRKVYVYQLKGIALKLEVGEDLFKKIEKANYREEDLSEIIVAINKHGQPDAEVQVRAYPSHKLKTKASLFFAAGMGRSSLSISGTSYLKGLTFNPVSMPYFSLGIDASGGRGMDRLIFRVELAYTSVSFHGEGKSILNPQNTISYDLQQSNFSPSFSFFYRLMEKKPLSIAAGAGIAYNISSYGKNVYHQTYPQSLSIEDYSPMTKSWFSAQLKLSAWYKSKFELGAYYQISGRYSQTTHYSYDPTTFAVWVGYHFGK